MNCKNTLYWQDCHGKDCYQLNSVNMKDTSLDLLVISKTKFGTFGK